ncbi:lysophospholipid acyltransferase 5 isoform X2 [Lepeophtheirus salmonis]|uniref:lysophospholipid acyltransferase 5 isoform X2 n=1 Tax=Lepeophtheirus salmonis TaxID=72036 RepID=UPI001AEAF4A1|nr:lysophospholipid acyltransferase 5-like isoform X2 [Lepeophtheirus salmonis]
MEFLRKQLALYLESYYFTFKLAYPVFWIFRGTFLSKSSADLQHVFFIITGLALSWWTFDLDAIYHGSFCILVTYMIISVFSPTYYSTLLSFIFNFGYLVVGYWFTETDSYDICWTMPHCVLTLRLIAVSFDTWDGTKKTESLGNDQLKNRLKTPPSLLELFSSVFFPASYFIGPQFSLVRYRSFVKRNEDGDIPVPPYFMALRRILLGVMYLIFHIVGSIYIPLDWITTPNYLNRSFGPVKVVLAFLWVKIMMSKYIGSWLLSEGSMIFSGLAYDPSSETDAWFGGANVRIKQWEFSGNLQNMIDSFNINTNLWSASYIYKRLKGLNNRTLSAGITLLFLALWHGLHSGYYTTFFLEFLMLNFERSLSGIGKQVSPYLGKFGGSIIGVIYIMLVLPHCFLPFGLLTWDKYWPVIKGSYGMPYGFFLIWPFVIKGIQSNLHTKKVI